MPYMFNAYKAFKTINTITGINRYKATNTIKTIELMNTINGMKTFI